MTLPSLDLQDPRLAAHVAARSIVISASAGSGKTFALVSLVLGFLGREGRAAEVIATTFGREAAADLKSRLLLPLDQLASWDEPTWGKGLAALDQDFLTWDAWLQTLDPAPRNEIAVAARQWLSGARPAWMESPRKAREHWVRTRREGELLQATTVHSLALSVLRRRGQGAEELVDAQAPRLLRLLRRAGREVLDLPEEHPDATVARRLWAWCENFEEGRDRWTALAAAFDGHLDALGTWRTSTDTGNLRSPFLTEGRRLLAAYAPFVRSPLSAAQLTKQGKPHGYFHRWGLAKLLAEPEGEIGPAVLLASLERLAQRFVASDGGKIPGYYSESFQVALEPLVEELPTLLERWTTLLLERVFRRFGELKTESRLVSYGDLVRQALNELQANPDPGPPALLLVDEYQDVNPVQEAFLAALGARRTVRVGDPKQAIYGFRGGVPELLRCQLAEAEPRGEAFRLTTNHRSAAPVVELANGFVDPIMPSLEPASADADGVQAHDGRGRGEGRVGLAAVPSLKRQGGDLPAAWSWIAALSRDAGWEAAGFAPGDGRPRRRALLLPRRTGLPALRRSLQAARIEPLVQSREGFWESPGVRLMMALLETAARPEAPGPLLVVLRSPWVGASDPELLAFQVAGSEDASPRIRQGLRWIEGLRALGTPQILAEGLARPGLLEFLAATEVHGSLEPARARRNLERFLGWAPGLPAVPALAWATLRQWRAFEDPGDAPAEDASADLVVQTIHGAKGLEYEDVILPMLADTLKGVRKGTVRQRPHHGRELWIGWKLGKARGEALRELQAEEEHRSFREGLNLLYVGLTRARERLMLLQQWSPKDGVPTQPESALARRGAGKAVCWQHVATDLAAAYPDFIAPASPPAPSALERPAAQTFLSPPPDREALDTGPGEPGAEASERARRGIQLHALLRELLVRDASDPEAARDYLARHPLLRAWPEAETLARNVLQELHARDWAKLPRRTEFALEGAGKRGGMGRADLVIWMPERRNPAGIIVVDFKLAAAFPAETLELHQSQLAGYREALQHTWPDARIEAWLVGLEGGLWLKVLPEPSPVS
jgi:superfamily I DNA/RNA helicase